jgi:hypothetical protein
LHKSRLKPRALVDDITTAFGVGNFDVDILDPRCRLLSPEA